MTTSTLSHASLKPTGPRYRRDVDGLRALAVLAVIVFHMNPTWLPGGFTGVDIFFVISGYLITALLRHEILSGEFSVRDFYLRRIRRIAPAYFAVTAATLLAGCLLLIGEDLKALAQSALWSTFSLPNVYYWLKLDISYFAVDVRQTPLLHLWSLGVEEQFYLVWPTLILVCYRAGSRLVTVAALTTLTIASFAFAQWCVNVDQKFAYYMLPTRMGELCIGGLLALWSGPQGRERDGGAVCELIAFAGLALVTFGLIRLDGESTFPGVNALYPTLGAALLLYAGGRRDCWLLTPMRWRPVVWVGLLSYSLYLWHWPLLAMLRYFHPEPSLRQIVYAGVATLLLATASQFLIEKRARYTSLPPRRQFWLLFALPTGLLATTAMVISAKANDIASLHQRSNSAILEQRRNADTAPAYEFEYNCQIGSADAGVLMRAQCHIGDDSPGRQALLWGDSHAAHYIGVIARAAQAHGYGLRNASYSTCPPILNGSRQYGSGEYKAGCGPFRELIGTSLEPYNIVFLGGQWNVYDRVPTFIRDLSSTVDTLVAQGKVVVLLAQVPQFPKYDRNCEIRSIRAMSGDCRTSSTRPDSGSDAINARLRRLASTRPGVTYFDVHDVLCRSGECSPYLDGHAVYFDSTHLSMAGSWRVGEHALLAGIVPAPFVQDARTSEHRN